MSMQTLDVASTRSRHKSVASQSQHIKTSHSPCKRSISQAPAQETQQQIKTGHSLLYRLSILQAPPRETHEWHRSKWRIKTNSSQCRRRISQDAKTTAGKRWVTTVRCPQHAATPCRCLKQQRNQLCYNIRYAPRTAFRHVGRRSTLKKQRREIRRPLVAFLIRTSGTL